MKVIVLAAGVGRRFGKETKKTPKCLIPLGKKGENLLSRYLESFKKIGLREVVIVCGHKKEKIKGECARKGAGLKISFIDNKAYKKGSILSLYSARKELNQDCLVMDADVYFPTAALKRLLDSSHETCFLVDSRVKSTGEEMMLMSKNDCPYAISKKLDPQLEILGEGVGFLKIGKSTGIFLQKILEDLVKNKKVNVEYEEAYNILLKKRKVGFETMKGLFWTEMDFRKDLEKIKRHIKGKTKP